MASKEREETNPEFKRVLAERAKRLERVKKFSNIILGDVADIFLGRFAVI